MVIVLNLLKWLGYLLLVVLIIALVIILLLLFAPFHYKASLTVDDPKTHEEFPISVIKNRSDVNAEVVWLGGILKLIIAFPRGYLISVVLFGKDLGVMKRFGKKKEEEKEEQPEEKKEEEKEEGGITIEKIERYFDAADHLHRILTGRCGRRAIAKVSDHLIRVVEHVLPRNWVLSGTVGLADPCLNGKLSGACAVLLPICDEHLQLDTEWENYRCDLKAEIDGLLRVIVPVKEVLPLLFDKDCLKLLKKLRKLKARFVPPGGELEKKRDQWREEDKIKSEKKKAARLTEENREESGK